MTSTERLRRLTMTIVAVIAVFAGMLAVPAQAQAAPLACGSNWPHSRSGHGSIVGGYTTFHLCWDNRYNARIDWNTSYVKDTKGDGKAPRAYLRYKIRLSSGAWTGWQYRLLGTATGGLGKVRHYQQGFGSTTGWAIVLCVGPKGPTTAGHYCSKAL